MVEKGGRRKCFLGGGGGGGGGICNYVYTRKKIRENELSDYQTISTQYILNI